MSGHSKWSTIKRAKEVNDLQRAKYFTKSLNQIVMAVKYGGDNVESNVLLKTSIDNAKSLNIPNKSIENAIKKGKGENKEYSNFEEVFYEAYGPGNTSILIECFTDNKNRVISEIRFILDRNEGKLVNNGTLNWQFELRVLFVLKIDNEINNKHKVNYQSLTDLSNIKDKDEFENDILNMDGIIDYKVDKEAFYLYVDPHKVKYLKDLLENKKILIYSIEKQYIPKLKIEVSSADMEKNNKLIDLLSNIDNIENIYVNI